MCCACKCKFGPLSILNWREGVLKGTVLHLPSMKNSHLVIDHHVIQIENFASYHVRRVVWFSSYNWMLVAFMRRSRKLTRFLMLWYLSKMSLHLETLLPLRLCGEWYVASNLTKMASTSGLASTCGRTRVSTNHCPEKHLFKLFSAFKRQEGYKMEREGDFYF